MALNTGPNGTGQNLEDQNQKHKQDYKLGEDLKYEYKKITAIKIRRWRYNIEREFKAWLYSKEKRIGTSPKQVTKVLEVQTCLFKDELDHWTQLKNTN